MKKYNLLKAIGIVFLFVIVLTWFIPIGSYSNGAFTLGDTAPVGIFDLSRIPLITIANLLQYGLIFTLIGGLYGVLNKTGVYSNLVEKIVSKLKGKEKIFLIFTICLMTILSSVVGLQYALFVIVPFLIAILMSLGFGKITSFASTIGAILVGNIGATYSTDISYYINNYLSLGVNNEILTKIIFLIIITFLFIMFILKGTKIKINSKKNKKNENNMESIPLYEVNSKKKSTIPLIVIFMVCFVLLIVNMINWEGIFNITWFSEVYNQITSIKIGDYPIVSNILGTITSFGSWTGYDMCIFLIIMTIIIGWLYSLKFEEFMDGFINGVKEMLVPAFYAVIANIVFATLYRFQSSANIYYTIVNFLMTTFSSLKTIMVGLSSFIGGIFYNDTSSLAVTLATPITTFVTDTTMYSLYGMMIQVLHGIVMMIIPTSILLVAGLSYMKISYKEWFKYIWKYLLEVLVIGIIIFIIVAMFI